MRVATSKQKKIAVIGGGIVGLTSALELLHDYDVTIIAEHIGILTNSSKATAIWHVYLVPETKEILFWAQQTLEKLCTLAANEPEAGIELVKGVELFRKGGPPCEIPTWSHIPRFFKMLTEKEIESYNNFASVGLTKKEISLLRNHPVMWGYHIEAPAASMQKYLPWLEKKVFEQGVRVEKKRLKGFDDISNEYEIIVNCSGFGARELCKDSNFVAYKGQYFIIKGSKASPKNYIGDDYHPGGMAYMIPRLGEVMIGGCAEKGFEDLELTLDWTDTLKRAGLYAPWLRTCSESDQARPPVVCIRPARATGVRLEVDLVSASVPIIHNYGHGGSGFSLSWGCAEAVKAMVTKL